MATLTIRNVDDAVRDALRERAQANGRSTEAEIRVLLESLASGTPQPLGHRCRPKRRFADLEPCVVDSEESAQETLDYLRGDR
jgi:plasmid stability protein